MQLEILHEPAAGRFSARVEGMPCRLDYRLQGATMTILRTEVPEPVRGRGIAAELVRAAFEAARTAGWRVVPACAYAAAWVQRHPEDAGLLD